MSDKITVQIRVTVNPNSTKEKATAAVLAVLRDSCTDPDSEDFSNPVLVGKPLVIRLTPSMYEDLKRLCRPRGDRAMFHSAAFDQMKTMGLIERIPRHTDEEIKDLEQKLERQMEALRTEMNSQPAPDMDKLEDRIQDVRDTEDEIQLTEWSLTPAGEELLNSGQITIKL